MNHEHQPRHEPAATALGAEVLQHWAVESLQTSAGTLHDFVRYGHPHIGEELTCYLIESGSAQSADELLTDLTDALVVLGDMQQRGTP